MGKFYPIFDFGEGKTYRRQKNPVETLTLTGRRFVYKGLRLLLNKMDKEC